MKGTTMLSNRCSGWVADAGRAVMIAAGLLAVIHVLPAAAHAVLGGAYALTLFGLVAVVLVGPLFAAGWCAEHAARLLGMELPDPGSLRAAFRTRIVRPLLCGDTRRWRMETEVGNSLGVGKMLT